MRDVAISKSEFVADQKAITKIQTWHADEVLWEYCSLPEVKWYSNFTLQQAYNLKVEKIRVPVHIGVANQTIYCCVFTY